MRSGHKPWVLTAERGAGGPRMETATSSGCMEWEKEPWDNNRENLYLIIPSSCLDRVETVTCSRVRSQGVKVGRCLDCQIYLCST